MAKTSSIDRIKIAALLLFVTISVALCAWAVWDSFSQTARSNPQSQDYQAVVGDAAIPTPTEWQQLDEPLPYPTDRFEMEN